MNDTTPIPPSVAAVLDDQREVLDRLDEYAARTRAAEQARNGSRFGDDLPPPAPAPIPLPTPVVHAPVGGIGPTAFGGAVAEIMLREGAHPLLVQSYRVLRRLMAVGVPMPGGDLHNINKLLHEIKAEIEWKPSTSGGD